MPWSRIPLPDKLWLLSHWPRQLLRLRVKSWKVLCPCCSVTQKSDISPVKAPAFHSPRELGGVLWERVAGVCSLQRASSPDLCILGSGERRSVQVFTALGLPSFEPLSVYSLPRVTASSIGSFVQLSVCPRFILLF